MIVIVVVIVNRELMLIDVKFFPFRFVFLLIFSFVLFVVSLFFFFVFCVFVVEKYSIVDGTFYEGVV